MRFLLDGSGVVIAPPPSGQVAQVELWNTDEFGETWYVTMTTGTSGATIFYKIGQNGFIDPTHNGGQATNGTSVYAGAPIPVPVGSTSHFRAVAYKEGMIDSVMADVSVDNVENGGNAPAAGQRTVTYQNDPLNRTGMNDNGAVTVYGPPSGVNQYTSVSGHTLAYDANFNLSGYDAWSFVYDAEKRLISASGSGTAMGQGHSAQFVYDGLGRCVKRTIDNVTTLITYDGWKPVAEWNGAGGLVAWNLYGPGADEILVRYDASASKFLYYHLDALGHVQFLLDANGDVLDKYTYDAFGHPKIMDGNGGERATTSNGNRFLFTGREYLSALGIYDYRNRAYHPELGRFMQIDPIGFKGDPLNLYRYCGSNPVGRADPMGLEGERFDNLVDAVLLARAQVTRAAFGQQKPVSDPVLKRPIVHSAMVPVLRRGREYELGPLVRGEVEKRYNKAGQSYGIERERLKPELMRRLVAAVHTHNDQNGVARPKWSDFDKDLPRQGKMAERADESNPGRWLRLVPAKNARGYQELDSTDINNPRPTDGNSSSDSASSGSTEKELRGVDFPNLAAEATNRASGPR